MVEPVKVLEMMGDDDEGDEDGSRTNKQSRAIKDVRRDGGCGVPACPPPWPAGTSIRSPWAGPSPGVLLEMGQLAEGLLAVRAVVGFDAQVDAQVLG